VDRSASRQPIRAALALPLHDALGDDVRQPEAFRQCGAALLGLEDLPGVLRLDPGGREVDATCRLRRPAALEDRDALRKPGARSASMTSSS